MLGRTLLGAGAVLFAISCSSDEASEGSGGSAGNAGSAGSGGAGAGGVDGGGATGGTAGAAGGGAAGASGSSPELLTIDRFEYQGAFRIPADDFGESSANYAVGPIAYNATNQSLFLVGHAQQNPIAEFSIPKIVASSTLSDLEMAAPPSQGFVTVLDDAAGGNPQSLGVIGGMLHVVGPNGPELLVNAYEYYDAPADNTQTTLVIRDAADLAASAKDGFFELTGAAHASGWMSPIPSEWQSSLGGSHITGHSSGVPIISRLSVGPSAFVFDPLTMVGVTNVQSPIPTSALLDYSLDNPLHADLSNDTGQNQIWTHLSRASYGFIAPGSRTYVTIGYSGGHASGVCYKCTPSGGSSNCGGYCANDANDNSHYYWLYDVNDLIAVKNGTKQPHEVLPYEFGVFPTPFASREIGGGAFDPASGLLYLNVLGADDEQGTYAVPPLIVVYRIQ